MPTFGEDGFGDGTFGGLEASPGIPGSFGSGTYGEGTYDGLTFGGGGSPGPPPEYVVVVPWAIDLESVAGGTVADDVRLAAFRVVWSLDGPGSFEAEVPAGDAGNWLAGLRRVILRPVPGGPIWAGWLTELSESTQSYDDLSKPRGTLLRASGLGLASVFSRRVVHGDFSKFLAVGTSIAWDLVQHAQGQTNGDYGFTFGVVDGTAPPRTRSYCDGDVIADAINELAAKDTGGFDWEIDALGKFNAWVGGRGDASGETLIRTDAMTWDVAVDTNELATFVTVLGDADAPCGAPLVIRSSGLASTYGRLEVVVEGETNDAGELNETGDEELRSRRGSRVRVHASWPTSNPPWAWGTVWLGDTLTVTLPAYFGGPQTMRVIEIKLSLEPPAFGYVEYELEAV